jgi:predicted metal-dependent phosphoesterase TrpH
MSKAKTHHLLSQASVEEARLSAARGDLYLHSRFTVGTLTPEKIAWEAKRAGMHTISLTDHDTVAGVPEARKTCREAGLRFIPGVELSVGYQNTEIHLLGYGIDSGGRRFRDTLDLLAAEREERMEKMVRRLNTLGVAALIEEVRAVAGGKILSRLHLATYLAKKGFVKSRDEAFTRHIGNGKPAYVRRRLLTLKESIDLIVGAGGLAVLAHPAMTKRDDLIEYLVRIGIRGIEVYYPMHSPGDVARYQKICRRFDLIATGGSDFHGSGKPDISIGMASTPPDELERLLRSL